MAVANYFKSGDWKSEKHVPVISLPEKINSNESFSVTVSIGDAIAHPNTLEHHISWMKLFYVQEGSSILVEVADMKFGSHGELDNFTDPFFTTKIKVSKPGKLVAMSYCNIHGLWENEIDIKF
ncbi:MAG: class II SORL domain-containing protein [Proteocatella sp.]